MTDDTMAFFNLPRERGGGDLLKDLAEAVLQKLMDYAPAFSPDVIM